jgi:TonB-dependent receptor
MRKSSRQRTFGGRHGDRFIGSSAGLAALLLSSAPLASAQNADQAPVPTAPAAPIAPAPAAAAAAAAAPSTELAEVVVVGTRAAQKASIDRKKSGATAMDSISAEDVGKFPDQNVNEAISRVAGVALDRGDNGEGQGISIRGNGPEATRVEIDGMSVLNTNGALSGGAGAATGGRAADLRELPAAIIKNIDVFKGTTAAMTEGSLGGTVRIETRNGLEFDKPFLQFSTDGQRNSITNELTPSGMATFAKSFMDNRFGVYGNVTYQEFESISDIQQPQTSGNAGPARNADFDQSPEKTFSYDPGIVDPTATAGNFRVLGAGGVPVYSSLSPIDILTRSAAAASPAACLAAFPALTQTQLNAIPAGDQVLGSVSTSAVTAANNRTAAQLEQTNGLQSCLNQWNDYAPSLIRAFPRKASEERLAAQLRFDYRVNDDTTVYVAYQQADRQVTNVDNTLNLGSPGYNQAGTFTQTAPPATSNALISPRTVNTGLGYSFNSTGLCGPPTTAGTGTTQTTTGCGVASDMTNVVVDDTHHITSFHLNDGNANIDAINQDLEVESWNWQTGAHFNRDKLKVDFMYGDSGSSWTRTQLRTAVNYTYGGVDAHITPSGLWAYDLPSGLDLANLPYAALNPVVARAVSNATTVQAASPAYTAAQAAQWGNNFTLTWRPAMTEDAENQAKLDIAYDVSESVPFVMNLQAGYQRRDHTGNGWAGGGYTVRPGTGNMGTAGYVAPVVVPTENLTVNYRSCMPTATSTQPCQYGYVPESTVGANNSPVYNLNNTLFGTMTFTPTELDALIQSALYTKDYSFLGDYPDKGNILTNWPYINPAVIAAAIPQQVIDLHCMKHCMSSIGTVFEQPHSAYSEVTDAAYFMFDFEQRLPWDMLVNGNLGARYVTTKVNATGFMTLAHTAVTAAYNPVTNPGGVVTTTAALNTSIADDTSDWLPAGNLNLWFTPEVVLRYYQGEVMSRPPPGSLLPSGQCTVDERNSADVNGTTDNPNTCTGRVGNPALLPFQAINRNLSLEWYPTQDLMFSVAHYRNKIVTGAPINANMPASTLFGGSDAVDPVTGEPLSDLDFTYPSYVNGSSGTQLGMEYSAKVAFTFLPWIFRHTGVDANYSELDFENFATSQDLMTGEYNPPQGQRSYFKNLTLWYDDTRFSARVSYQGQSEFFDFISSCSNAINNYPTSFAQCPGQTIRTPYNPGGTNYREATEFIDLKLGYQFTPNIGAYFTGRNITRELTYRSLQPNNTYSDGAPTLEQMSYGGARWQVGVVWRN